MRIWADYGLRITNWCLRPATRLNRAEQGIERDHIEWAADWWDSQAARFGTLSETHYKKSAIYGGIDEMVKTNFQL